MLVRVWKCDRNTVPFQNIAVRSTTQRNSWDEQEVGEHWRNDERGADLLEHTISFFTLTFTVCWNKPALRLLFLNCSLLHLFVCPLSCNVWYFYTSLHRFTLRTVPTSPILPWCSIPHPRKLDGNSSAWRTKTILRFLIWHTEYIVKGGSKSRILVQSLVNILRSK